VLENDSDVDDDVLTVVSTTAPAHGTATIGDSGIVTYSPVTGYQGDDEFTYTVQDVEGAEATATVFVGVGIDTDDDGLIDFDEEELGTDPNDPDSDDDELMDGLEVNVIGTDPLDDDSDDDGLLDGNEDANHDGVVDAEETSPLEADTDGDGLQDGTELGLSASQGDDTDEELFVPDADTETTTDPLDDDSDDDGLMDGSEDADHDGQVGEGETDPVDPDTDGDTVLDGTERGLTEPEGDDTDEAVFVPDADPTTTTDPLNRDTDGGGESDGAEDSNRNGRIDEGETDPNDPTDDDTGVEPILDDSGGCNCRTTSAGHTGTEALIIFALLWLVRVRRRGR